MASTAVAKRLSKPDWNNVQRRDLYKQIYIGMGLGTVASIFTYFKWYIPKWQAIEDYQR